MAAIPTPTVALLLTAPSSEQLEVMKGIYQGFRESGDWPIWAWVDDYVLRSWQGKINPAFELASMPTLKAHHPASRPYGLTWREHAFTDEPLDSERVGLSLAGVAALRSAIPTEGYDFANGVADVIGEIARHEQMLPVTPSKVSTRDVPLADFTGYLTVSPFKVSEAAIGQLLRKELQNFEVFDLTARWVIRLTSNRLRRYRRVTSAETYLEVIDTLNAEMLKRSGDEVVDDPEFRPLPAEAIVAPLDSGDYDPELWAHVVGLLDAGDWGKVPAAVAIYVEHQVRSWSGLSNAVVGKNLYATALGEKGKLAVGAVASEQEGWRMLGMGLVQAVGNVARHRLQTRDDERRYAVGVLGLGSLLLTQIQLEHPELK